MNPIKRIIRALALLLILPIATGCYRTAIDGPEIFDGDLSLLLRVSVLEPGKSGTRAESDTIDYELPVYDTEKLQTLRVIIVNPDGKVIHNYFERLNQPGNSYSNLRFKVDFSTTYNIYLIGNESGLPADVQTTLRAITAETTNSIDLDNLTFSAPVIAGPYLNNTGTTKTLIPMSEKFTVTTIDRPNAGPEVASYTMEKEMFLTRALTKFSFNFKTSADYTGTNRVDIKSVKITGLGTSEYLFPKNAVYDPAKEDKSLNPYGGRDIKKFDVPASNSIGEYVFTLPANVTLFPNETAQTRSSYSPQLYFTESLGNEGPDKFQCSVSFDGVNFLPPVTLPALSILPRNTHVMINITFHEIGFSITVEPWVFGGGTEIDMGELE